MLLLRSLAVILLASMAAACAARGGVPRPFPGAPAPPGVTAEPPSDVTAEPLPPRVEAERIPPSERDLDALNSELLTTAMALRGTPYRDGGSDPGGFDCSGFVQYVFAKAGLWLPRAVREQFHAGGGIDQRDLQPGDLVFFETVSRGASHVGLMIDAVQFIHAPSSRGVVRVERLATPYWARRYVGARRIRTDDSE